LIKDFFLQEKGKEIMPKVRQPKIRVALAGAGAALKTPKKPKNKKPKPSRSAIRVSFPMSTPPSSPMGLQSSFRQAVVASQALNEERAVYSMSSGPSLMSSQTREDERVFTTSGVASVMPRQTWEEERVFTTSGGASAMSSSRSNFGEQSFATTSSHQATKQSPSSSEHHVHSAPLQAFSSLSLTSSLPKARKPKRRNPIGSIPSYAWELMTIYAAEHSQGNYTTESLVSTVYKSNFVLFKGPLSVDFEHQIVTKRGFRYTNQPRGPLNDNVLCLNRNFQPTLTQLTHYITCNSVFP
jgi:hypothetical protein